MIVSTQTYDAPPYRLREILRYAKVRGDAPEIEALLKDCLRELEGQLTYRVCYAEFPIVPHADSLSLGFTDTDSLALRRNLDGCERLLLFAATVGIGIDRLIARHAPTSPTKALLFDAIGAERIEALCDAFCADTATKTAAQGYAVRPRFSPGYGDFPLDAQRKIFSVLDCPHHIGLTLNESLLMSPSKSVTALIGLTAIRPSQDDTQ